MGKHSTTYTGGPLPKEVRPISSWGYIGYSILYAIPVIGWLFLIIFTFSRNRNRRNFARSYWCRLLIFLIIAALCALGYVIFKDDINAKIAQYMDEGRAKLNEMGFDGFMSQLNPEYPTVEGDEEPLTEEETETEPFFEEVEETQENVEDAVFGEESEDDIAQ